MEQEAEMEGGPIADRYGAMLNKIDKAIAQLQGDKREKEYTLRLEDNEVNEYGMLGDFEAERKFGLDKAKELESKLREKFGWDLSKIDVPKLDTERYKIAREMGLLEEDKDEPSFYDYPENKHLDDRDPEERRALKEMFKKIIVNLINE